MGQCKIRCNTTLSHNRRKIAKTPSLIDEKAESQFCQEHQDIAFDTEVDLTSFQENRPQQAEATVNASTISKDGTNEKSWVGRNAKGHYEASESGRETKFKDLGLF